MAQEKKTALLLVNLGSPDSPSVKDVRRYLGEFLMDGRVIDVPWLIRKMIVSLFVLPFRPARSAGAYAKIWTREGSPLVLHTRDLAGKLEGRVPWPVYFAMRYGNPSIRSVLKKIQTDLPELTKLRVVPLYPHYAMSSYETAWEKVVTEHRRLKPGFDLERVPAFYDDPAYISALAGSIAPLLEKKESLNKKKGRPYLVFSYHGIPVRQLEKTDPTGQWCRRTENCCDAEIPTKVARHCYRHQVLRTSLETARRLGLGTNEFEVVFQSRLGRAEWLSPYLSQRLTELPGEGKKNIVVVTPSFVSDCLETLEEVEIEARETFKESGGEIFRRVPCLNEDEDWVEALARICEKAEAPDGV